MKIKNPIKKYVCCSCDCAHSNESSAEECCPNEVVTVFLCQICEAVFDEEKEAIDCCIKKHDDPLAQTYISPVELEKYGQERLFQ